MMLPLRPAARGPALLCRRGLASEVPSSGVPSFISKAKAGGAQALLGLLHTGGGFDSALSKMTLTEVEKGHVRAVLPVTSEVSNFYGTLHGGAVSTIVDVIGTVAILSQDVTKPGVSVELVT